ncbi:MAG: hypothetical protein Q9185_006708 [Variospora sp. 1 TL-2023]
MKITGSLILGVAALGAKLALAAPFVERVRSPSHLSILKATANNDQQYDCRPDGWCGTSQAGLPSSACCSGRAWGNCCLSKKRDVLPREISANKAFELTVRDLVATPAVVVKKRGKAKKPCPAPPPPPPPSSTVSDGVTLTPTGPAPLLGTEAPPPLLPPREAKRDVPAPHVTAPVPIGEVGYPYYTFHVPVPANPTPKPVGPGWHHSLAVHPLPTTLATVLRERAAMPATPPLCVAGVNCSQGSPNPENNDDDDDDECED